MLCRLLGNVHIVQSPTVRVYVKEILVSELWYISERHLMCCKKFSAKRKQSAGEQFGWSFCFCPQPN